MLADLRVHIFGVKYVVHLALRYGSDDENFSIYLSYCTFYIKDHIKSKSCIT